MRASSRTVPATGENTEAGSAILTETPDGPAVAPADGSPQVKGFPTSLNESLYSTDKPTLKEPLNYLRHLKRSFEYKTGRFASVLQFAAVGLSGMMVDLYGFALAQWWLTLPYARALAIWAAMTWNYILNRHLTFSHARTASFGRQYVLFCASCLVGALANWSISVALCKLSAFFAQAPLLAAGIGVLAGFVFNYCLSCRLVFRSREPASEEPRA